MNAPVFSVIIPAFNCERFIRAAINSVLHQTFNNFEIIIVLDKSSDQTELEIQAMERQDERIKCIRNKRRLGVAESRNVGMQIAKGQYIAFLDADDLWLPEKLQKQYMAMCLCGSDLCYTSYSFIDENGQATGRTYKVPKNINYRNMLSENSIGTSTCVIKSEIAKCYRFNESYYHEDYVFWLELLKSGKVATGLPDILTHYRVLIGSRSNNKIKAAKERWRIYRNYVKMNRRQSGYYLIKYMVAAVRKYWKGNDSH